LWVKHDLTLEKIAQSVSRTVSFQALLEVAARDMASAVELSRTGRFFEMWDDVRHARSFLMAAQNPDKLTILPDGRIAATAAWQTVLSDFCDEAGHLRFGEFPVDSPQWVVLHYLLGLDLEMARLAASGDIVSALLASPEKRTRFENVLDVAGILKEHNSEIPMGLVRQLSRFLEDDVAYKNLELFSTVKQTFPFIIDVFNADGVAKEVYRDLLKEYLRADGSLDMGKVFAVEGGLIMFLSKVAVGYFSDDLAAILSRTPFFEKHRAEALKNPAEYLEKLMLLGRIARGNLELGLMEAKYFDEFDKLGEKLGMLVGLSNLMHGIVGGNLTVVERFREIFSAFADSRGSLDVGKIISSEQHFGAFAELIHMSGKNHAVAFYVSRHPVFQKVMSQKTYEDNLDEIEMELAEVLDGEGKVVKYTEALRGFTDPSTGKLLLEDLLSDADATAAFKILVGVAARNMAVARWLLQTGWLEKQKRTKDALQNLEKISEVLPDVVDDRGRLKEQYAQPLKRFAPGAWWPWRRDRTLDLRRVLTDANRAELFVVLARLSNLEPDSASYIARKAGRFLRKFPQLFPKLAGMLGVYRIGGMAPSDLPFVAQMDTALSRSIVSLEKLGRIMPAYASSLKREVAGVVQGDTQKADNFNLIWDILPQVVDEKGNVTAELQVVFKEFADPSGRLLMEKVIGRRLDTLKFMTYYKVALVDLAGAEKLAKGRLIDRYVDPSQLDIDWRWKDMREATVGGLSALAEASPALLDDLLTTGKIKNLVGILGRSERLSLLAGWLRGTRGILEKDGAVSPMYRDIFKDFTDAQGRLNLNDLVTHPAKVYAMIALINLLKLPVEHGPRKGPRFLALATWLVAQPLFQEVLKDEDRAVNLLVLCRSDAFPQVVDGEGKIKREYRRALKKWVVYTDGGFNFSRVLDSLAETRVAAGMMDIAQDITGLAEQISADLAFDKLAGNLEWAKKFEDVAGFLPYFFREDGVLRRYPEVFRGYLDFDSKLDLSRVFKDTVSFQTFYTLCICSMWNVDFVHYLRSTGWLEKMSKDAAVSEVLMHFWKLKRRVGADGTVRREWRGVLAPFLDAQGRVDVSRLAGDQKEQYYLMALIFLAEADKDLAEEAEAAGILRDVFTDWFVEHTEKMGLETEPEIIEEKGETFVGLVALLAKVYGSNPAFARMILSNAEMLEGFLKKEDLLADLSVMQQVFERVLDGEGRVKKAYRKGLSVLCDEDGRVSFPDEVSVAHYFVALAEGITVNRAFVERLADDGFAQSIMRDVRMSKRLREVFPALLEIVDETGALRPEMAGVFGGFLTDGRPDLGKVVGSEARVSAFKTMVNVVKDNPALARRLAAGDFLGDVLDQHSSRLRPLLSVSSVLGKVCDEAGRVTVEGLGFFCDQTGKINWDKVLSSDKTARLFVALAEIALDEKKAGVSVLGLLEGVLRWDTVLESEKALMGFCREVAPNLLDWYKDNPEILGAIPTLVENGLEYSMLTDSYDFVPLDRELAERLFDHLRDIGRAPPQRRGFQVAYTHMISAASNKSISREQSRPLLSRLLQSKTEQEYYDFLRDELVPRIRENLARERPGSPFLNADWKRLLVLGAVGWDIPGGRRYTMDLDKVVSRVEFVLDHLGVNRDDTAEYLLGLVYALNLRFYTPATIQMFPPGFHRLHEFGMYPWNTGAYWGRFIVGNLLALPSEIAHATGYELDRDLEMIKEAEIQDRLGAVNILRKHSHLAFENASEYVVQATRFSQEILLKWAEGALPPAAEESLLKALKGLVTLERYTQIVSAQKNLLSSEIDRNVLLAMLSPSEVYSLGKLLAKDELSLEDAVVEFRRQFIVHVREKAEIEIDQAVGVMAMSSEKVRGVKDVVMKPYEFYDESHEVAERITQDVFVKLVLTLSQANIDINILPYMNAKAMEWVLSKTFQRTDTDWRAVVVQLEQMDVKMVRQWLAELVEEGIVTEDESASKRVASFEELVLLAVRNGVSLSSALWDAFKKLPPGDLVVGLMDLAAAPAAVASTVTPPTGGAKSAWNAAGMFGLGVVTGTLACAATLLLFGNPLGALLSVLGLHHLVQSVLILMATGRLLPERELVAEAEQLADLTEPPSLKNGFRVAQTDPDGTIRIYKPVFKRLPAVVQSAFIRHERKHGQVRAWSQRFGIFKNAFVEEMAAGVLDNLPSLGGIRSKIKSRSAVFFKRFQKPAFREASTLERDKVFDPLIKVATKTDKVRLIEPNSEEFQRLDPGGVYLTKGANGESTKVYEVTIPSFKMREQAKDNGLSPPWEIVCFADPRHNAVYYFTHRQNYLEMLSDEEHAVVASAIAKRSRAQIDKVRDLDSVAPVPQISDLRLSYLRFKRALGGPFRGVYAIFDAARQMIRGDVEFKPFLRKERKDFILSMVWFAVSAALAITVPWLIGQMLDVSSLHEVGKAVPSLVPVKVGGVSMGASTGLLILTFGLFLANALDTWQERVSTWVSGRMEARILRNFVNHFVDQISGKSMGFFRKRKSVEIAARIRDMSHIIFKNVHIKLYLPNNIIMLVSSTAMLFLMDFKIAVIVLFTMTTLALLSTLFGKRLEDLDEEVTDSETGLVALASDLFSNMETMKIFNIRPQLMAHFAKRNEALTKVRLKKERTWSYYSAFSTTFSQALTNVSIILIGCWSLFFYGHPSVGEIVAMEAYALSVNSAVEAFSSNWVAFREARGKTKRIMNMLNAVPEIQDNPDAVEVGELQGHVEFRNVNFSYVSGNKVLKNVSFEVKPGQKVAFVGGTGSGKTTVMRLLCRLYDPSAGDILVDGHNLKDVKFTSLADQMAIVPQNSALFDGTVRQNLLFIKPDASEAEMADALRRAKAEFLFDEEMFPDGLDTEIGEGGSRFSGGQKQRIAIARAVLRNPKVLLLDEATSALDNESERLVQEGLNDLMKGRTTFVVAHRLTTIMDADVIHFLEKGRIVESGTHAELMALRGRYYQMWMAGNKAPVKQSEGASKKVGGAVVPATEQEALEEEAEESERLDGATEHTEEAFGIEGEEEDEETEESDDRAKWPVVAWASALVGGAVGVLAFSAWGPLGLLLAAPFSVGPVIQRVFAMANWTRNWNGLGLSARLSAVEELQGWAGVGNVAVEGKPLWNGART
ncbi:MAG TPA: ABC transporter ATP-binding protein, partial [Elusimicrobiota bacterium]|nr:ABC transporter ATP-binding protein [Elusimicrobiota bacterium]